jgi:hypothetical protein
LQYLLGLLLDVDSAPCPPVEVGPHEGVDLGEERGADDGGADEREHGAPHGAVERAVHGGDVVGAEDVEHGLGVARDEAGALAGEHPPVQLRVHAHHRRAAQDVRPEQAAVPATIPIQDVSVSQSVSRWRCMQQEHPRSRHSTDCLFFCQSWNSTGYELLGNAPQDRLFLPQQGIKKTQLPFFFND